MIRLLLITFKKIRFPILNFDHFPTIDTILIIVIILIFQKKLDFENMKWLHSKIVWKHIACLRKVLGTKRF